MFRCTLHASSYRVRGILGVFFFGSSHRIIFFGEVCFGKGQTTDELKHMREEQRRQEESRVSGVGQLGQEENLSTKRSTVQLVIPIFPKDPDIILLWGWDCDHRSYSRKGFGFLGFDSQQQIRGHVT